jgi:hypothetical protein
MKTNTSLTRFKKSVSDHEEVWTRILIGRAFWMKKTKATVTEAGLLRADNTVVYIPFSQADEGPAVGDILIKGTVEVSIEGNMTVGELVRLYPDSMVVKSCDPKDFGSVGMRHWQVEGS